MKTRPTRAAHARLIATSGALALAAALLISAVAVGSAPDAQSIDPATQAAWLTDHFRCEHHAEMAGGLSIDPATQAAWLTDHFRCEHHAEMAEA
jgi:hypothetical protein